MTVETFSMVMNGIFNSTLIYCLPVYGNVWLQGDQRFRYRSFKKDDLRRLQVLQNRALRLLTNLPSHTSTEVLVKSSGQLSVHQLTAYHSLVSLHKVVVSGKPDYLAKKLVLKRPEEGRIFPHRQEYTLPVTGRLTTTRGGYCHRSARIYNTMPLHIRACMSTTKFKKLAKNWVKENIAIKP